MSWTFELEVLCDIQVQMQLGESSRNRGNLKLWVQNKLPTGGECMRRGPETQSEQYAQLLVEQKRVIIVIILMHRCGKRRRKHEMQQHISNVYYKLGTNLCASYELIFTITLSGCLYFPQFNNLRYTFLLSTLYHFSSVICRLNLFFIPGKFFIIHIFGHFCCCSFFSLYLLFLFVIHVYFFF